MGKIPEKLLEKYVFKRMGTKRDDVILGSGVGIDFSAMLTREEDVVIAHCDPIVGALEKIGWLSVHVACNDVATSGASPRWILPTILLPEKWEEKMLNKISKDIDSAAKELGVSIVGGHTGYAPGLSRPIVVVTCLGACRRDDIVLPINAKENDLVFITKGAAIEGTAILASDFRDILLNKGVSDSVLKKASKYIREISVVKEAIALARAKAVSAMHDATRGGVAEALIELAVASNKTLEIWADKIPVRKETRILAETLNFDPLWMISSGTLVFTVPKDKEQVASRILEALEIKYSKIGVVRKGKPKVILHRKEHVEIIEKPMPEKDELARLWNLYPRVKT